MKIIAILAVGTVISVSAQAEPPGKPGVCERVAQLNSENPGTTEFMKALQAVYPSCAKWLAKSCLSASLLDRDTVFGNNGSGDTLKNVRPVETNFCVPTNSVLERDTQTTLTTAAKCAQATQDRSPGQAFQNELAHQALEHWELINRKRDEDLKTILSYFDRENLPKEVSNQNVRAAIGTLGTRVKAAAEHADTADKKDWQKFVADQIADAGNDTATNWKDAKGVQHTDVDPGFYTRLENEKTDSDRWNELVTRAKKIDHGEDDEFDGNLTPYHSKMILLYFLENSLRTKYKSEPRKADAILNEIANQLHLKADFTAHGPTKWNMIIPHDGFVLGASPHQMHNLLDFAADPAAQRNIGTGIDCATFAQNMLIRSGYAAIGKIGRLTSYAASQGALKSISKMEPMNGDAIAKLGPGDLIVERPKDDPVGHIQIVVGYEGNPPGVVVVSAEGGYERSVIKRRINIYPKQPDDCGKENHFTEDSNLTFYRVSLTKGPK